MDESYYPCTGTTQSDTECKSYDKKYYTSRNRCEHTEYTEENQKNPYCISYEEWKSLDLDPVR